MSKKKRLQELTIKDNFMFGAVMADEDNCKPFLQMVLGVSIERVEVSKERSIIYHPEYRGVRLDEKGFAGLRGEQTRKILVTTWRCR